MRACVAEIIAETLESLPLRFPDVPREEKKRMAKLRAKLEKGKL